MINFQIIRNRAAINLLKKIKHFDPKKIRVISGEGRGGTTWVEELVSSASGVSCLWEPLHPGEVKEYAKLNLGHGPFLSKDDVNSPIKDYITKVHSGKILNPYLLFSSGISKHFYAETLVVKYCRLNPMMEWFIHQFELNYPPIHLLRHPCAVVNSQMNHSGWDNISKNSFLRLDQNEPLMSKYHSLIRGLKTKEELLAARWCLNNVSILEKDLNVTRFYYEWLIEKPHVQIPQIFQKLNIQQPSNIKSLIASPSKSNRKGGFESTKRQEQLSKWKTSLNDTQIQKILNVLSAFDIEIYNEDIMPSQSINH